MAVIVSVIVYDSGLKDTIVATPPAKVISENKNESWEVNHNIAKIGRRSSGFGYRIHPIKRKKRLHAGVDFAAPKGTKIKATGKAVVKFVGKRGGYGNMVILNHGQGVTTRYAHMSRFRKGLKKGKLVPANYVIGYVGSTGGSTGNHLHYEYRVFGKPINPFGKNTLLAASTRHLKKGITLKRLIVKGESSKRYKDDYNRGSDKCSGSNRKFVRISNMTVGTIKNKQAKKPCSKDRLHAVGWPQVIGDAMKDCQRYMGFSNRRKYNLKLQDRIFVECLTKAKRPAIHKYVVTGKGLKIAGRAVAREWTSMGSPIHCKIKRYKKLKNGKKKFVGYRPWSRGGGCYNSGYGINHHSVSATKVLKALQKARHNYLILRKRGVTHMKAYAHSIGVKGY